MNTYTTETIKDDMKIYLSTNFIKDWDLYRNNSQTLFTKIIYEYMLCKALSVNNFHFAHALLDLNLISLPNYVISGYSDITGSESSITALMLAINKENLDMIKKLKDKGADIDATNNRQMTPIMYAIYNNKIICAEMLIKLGANVNAQDDEGRTVLMYAGARGYCDIFKKLLNAGANIDIKDKKGKTVNHLLESWSFPYESTLKELKALINGVKEKEINTNDIIITKTKDKCNYGIDCINFKNKQCDLEHIVQCYYGIDCKNHKQGICKLEH